MSGKMNIMKNPVSLLQEIAIQLGKIPSYKYEEMKEQEFKCIVTLCDMTVECKGKGKKSAKMLAAEGMLRNLGMLPCSANLNDVPKSSFDVPQPSCSESAPTCPSSIGAFKRPRSPLILNTPPIKSTCLSESEDYKNGLPHSSISCTDNGLDQFLKSSYKSIDNSFLDSVKISNVKDSNPIQSVTESDKEEETDTMCNPVSLLQMKMNMSHEVPKYTHIGTENFGMRNVMYFFEVSALGQTAVGSGPSKKEAKSNAAASLLSFLGYGYKESPSIMDIKDNLVGKLQEFCQTNYVNKIPSYTVEEKEVGHQKVFTMQCTLDAFSVRQSALTKKLAKQMCAKEMLELLEKNKTSKKLDNIVYESKILDKSINDLAWQKLLECRNSRGKVNFNSTLTSIPLKEYPNLFENNYFGQSDTHMVLKLTEKSEIYNLSDPRTVFCGILDELSIKHEVMVMSSKDSVAMNLFIKSQPPWSFIEIKKTKEEAEKMLFITALEFLHDM